MATQGEIFLGGILFNSVPGGVSFIFWPPMTINFYWHILGNEHTVYLSGKMREIFSPLLEMFLSYQEGQGVVTSLINDGYFKLHG